MSDSKEMLEVNVKVEIPASAIKSVVENSKQIAGTDASGIYRIDTAAGVGKMISRFLAEYDFESFAEDINNYS